MPTKDTAILTITVGKQYEALAVLTHPTIKLYADKIGAEFIVLDRRVISQTTSHFEKFQIYHLLNQYKRILFVDTDLIIRSDCPNLFEIVPENELGVFNEAPFTERKEALFMASQQYNIKIDEWNNQYYNTGVMVISRIHKQLFKKPEMEISNFYEQSYLNLIILKNRIKVHKLDYKFNRMTCVDRLTGEHRLASYIVHYAGCPNLQAMTEIIGNDLVRWNKEEFNHKRNILIKVHGGIGDEVAAEPVIRHIIEKIYPDQNVQVMTWFPRIFKHLPVKIHRMGKLDTEPDTPYYIMNTLVETTHPAWMFMTISLMHPVEYIGLLLLKKMLPDDVKQPILSVDKEDLDEVQSLVKNVDINKLIVVHPGRGWPSKTFPEAWYDKIIDGLLKAGRHVAVIGKWMNEDQGTVKVTIKDGVTDLRNLLTLGGSFALLSKACVLISNDSSPIHIASAFDNHIILIPSCKHPDHVLHVRKGTRYHKAIALYKKLTCDTVDSTPTMIHDMTTIDKVIGDIHDYIPEPEQVVEEAIKRSIEFY